MSTEFGVAKQLKIAFLVQFSYTNKHLQYTFK